LRGLAGALLAFLVFSEVFSTGSTDLSTDVDACDLLSHVDSEDMLGCEDTSSSLAAVEEDRASMSGVDASDTSTDCEGTAGFEGFWDWVSLAAVGCSVAESVSASSAQFPTEATEVRAALEVSLAGVAEPEAGLLTDAGEETPLAACAYENVAAIVFGVDAVKQWVYVEGCFGKRLVSLRNR
jgi:hypothetical protein